jgi:hypothetical protein
MPLKFWDKAFISVVYLINRTHNKTIQYTKPLERLFHVKLDYTSLRIFGCECWLNLRPYNHWKLEFRSKQCVFLGYSPIHKGFKCLNIPTGRVYISMGVIFDKNIFPFANLHCNAGARLQSEVLLLPSTLLNSGFSYQGARIYGDHVINVSNPATNNSGSDSVEISA